MGGGEFLRWKVFFEEELNAFHREDYMLARIAQVVRQGQVKPEHASQIKLEDMLVEFTTGHAPAAAPPLDPEARLQRSKNYWSALVGAFSRPRMPPKQPRREA
jgi:hypothetical protein